MNTHTPALRSLLQGARSAPNYDMLPMQFIPRGMELTDIDFQPPQTGGVAFEQPCTLAQQFWRLVSESARISPEFKVIAQQVLTKF